MLCTICNEKEYKYTCPKCKCRYCSLACFKSLKHVELDENLFQKSEVNEKKDNNESNEEEPTTIKDPMLQELVNDRKFKEYIASPVLQYHILTILEILDNVSLTNEYSKDGRLEIASRKLNNLRYGGMEENQFVNEFISWLINWMETFKSKST